MACPYKSCPYALALSISAAWNKKAAISDDPLQRIERRQTGHSQRVLFRVNQKCAGNLENWVTEVPDQTLTLERTLILSGKLLIS